VVKVAKRKIEDKPVTEVIDEETGQIILLEESDEED